MNYFSKIALKIKFCVGYAVSYLAFSHSCVLCGQSATYIPLCKTCKSRLIHETQNSLLGKRCNVCGKELFSEKETCLDCRKPDSLFAGFAGVFPIFMYVLNKKNLLFQWKIAGNRSLVFFYAKVFSLVILQKYKDIPIVPVPPRPNKIKKKGWDQIQELVSVLQSFYKISVVNLLKRVTGYEQKKQSRTDRFSLSKTAFCINKKVVEKLCKSQKIPETVILIDDVITTGATVITCKDLLHSIGIKNVYVISLFKVP